MAEDNEIQGEIYDQDNEHPKFATSSEVINDNFLLYAGWTINAQFAHVVDGLKLIHRRILWTIRDKDELTKLNLLIGLAMKLHPYGDKSIEDAMTRLAQPFNNIVPFINIKGNLGSYHEDGNAAAARYLDACISDFCTDVYFKNINEKTLNFVVSETGDGWEPEFLIPVIPMAFITNVFGIGMGFKSVIPSINLASVCDLVRTYVNIRRTNPNYNKAHKEIAKYLIPDFPIRGLLRNHKELLRNYSEGVYDTAIEIDGTMTLEPDQILLHTFPPGKAFQKTYMETGRHVIEKDGFIPRNFQSFYDSSKLNYSCIECKLRRGVSPFDVLDKFKQQVGFSGKFHPILSYVVKEQKAEMTPLQILEIWYRERYRSVLSGLKYVKNKLITEQRKLSAMIMYVDHTDDIVSIFKHSEAIKDTYPQLAEKYQLTEFQSAFLATLPMGGITKEGKDGLIADKEANEQKLHDLDQKFITIDEQIVDDAQAIKKKYSAYTSRSTRLPEFKGCVKIGDKGLIQYWDEEDRNKIVRSFGQDNVSFIEYPPTGVFYKYLFTNAGVITEQELAFPKELPGSNLFVSQHRLKCTIALREGTIYRLDELIWKRDATVSFTPVGDEFISIKRNGLVELVQSVGDVPKRRQTISQGVKTDIIYVSPNVTDKFVVAYSNTSEPNTIRLNIVQPGKKLNCVAGGTTIVIGIYKLDESTILSLPEEACSRSQIRHVQIKRFDELVTEDKCYLIYLSRKVTSTRQRLTTNKKHPDVWYIV